MLLPSDVHGRPDQPNPQPDHALRRPVPSVGGGVVATAAVDAVATVVVMAAEDAVGKLIAERDAKRCYIDDIPKYRRYSETVETSGHYAGTRSVGSQQLALLQRENGVEVLLIDAATVLRLKRFRIGDAITVGFDAQTTGHPAGPAPVPTYTLKLQTRRTTTLQKRRSR